MIFYGFNWILEFDPCLTPPARSRESPTTTGLSGHHAPGSTSALGYSMSSAFAEAADMPESVVMIVASS